MSPITLKDSRVFDKASRAELRVVAQTALLKLAEGPWSHHDGVLWAPGLTGEWVRVADIRGLQYLTAYDSLNLTANEATTHQNAWAEHMSTFSPTFVIALLDLLDAVEVKLSIPLEEISQ